MKNWDSFERIGPGRWLDDFQNKERILVDLVIFVVINGKRRGYFCHVKGKRNHEFAKIGEKKLERNRPDFGHFHDLGLGVD